MIRLFIRWPKYWSFSISTFSEYSGLISFWIDWFDLLAVQRTLKSLLQHHNSKASIPWHSAFFTVQLSHPYVTARKTIAFEYTELCHPSDVSIFNMLSWFVIAFLPKNKCLWVSWLLSPCTVILELKKIKSATLYTFSSSVCQEVMTPDAMIFVFCMLSFKPAFHPLSPSLRGSLLPIFQPLQWHHLRLLIFLLAIMIPACESSGPAFHMMYSAYKLNKQFDSI